jgi:hypothetical protein
MARTRFAAAALLAAACSVSDAAPAPTGDRLPTGTPSSSSTPAPAASEVPSVPRDAGAEAADAAGPGYVRTYRNSLSVCWTDAGCTRSLVVAHGGDWSYAGPPYDSNAALEAAYTKGADAVKVDARMTKDGVAVVSHSSPLEAFESLDCLGKRIEQMTVAEVTACHRVPSSSETYQRLSDVLVALRGRLVVQICVKVAAEAPAISAAVLAAGAEDYALLEIDTSTLVTIVPTVTGGPKLWYLVDIHDVAEVETLLGTAKSPRARIFEFAPDVAIGALATTRLRPAGIRTFTYDKQATTKAQVKARFDTGFDIVSVNATAPAVEARQAVNASRSVTPP